MKERIIAKVKINKGKIIQISCIFFINLFLLLTISEFSSSNFMFEIVTSFLPYTFALGLIFFLTSLIYFLIKKPKLTKLSLLVIISTLIFLTSAGYKIINFAYIPNIENVQSGTELKLAFFNMQFQNTNYMEISNEIKKLDPDILGIAELTPERVGKISALNDYPYVVSASNFESKDVAIFSKYKLTHNTSLDSDTNYFISAKTLIEDKEYNIVVAHPLPPTDQYLLNLGDIVLKKIDDRFKDPNTIILGDFNLTPWSERYTDFTSNFSNLVDTSKGKGLNFTWGDFPLYLHVDHIWVPNGTQIKEYGVKDKMMSDHNLIFSRVIIF
ncbi:MAG: endonuclease/exonuclease/phosphatase family protein [bacterium]